MTKLHHFDLRLQRARSKTETALNGIYYGLYLYCLNAKNLLFSIPSYLLKGLN